MSSRKVPLQNEDSPLKCCMLGENPENSISGRSLFQSLLHGITSAGWVNGLLFASEK
jgi:hypothetical protein